MSSTDHQAPNRKHAAARARAKRRRQSMRPDERELFPVDAQAFKHRGVVSDALRPIYSGVRREAKQMREDLGGDLSAMKLALLADWERTAVLARAWLKLALIADWPSRPNERANEKAISFLRLSAQLLGQLGLERRARPVPSLSDYIETNYEKQEEEP